MMIWCEIGHGGGEVAKWVSENFERVIDLIL